MKYFTLGINNPAKCRERPPLQYCCASMMHIPFAGRPGGGKTSLAERIVALQYARSGRLADAAWGP